MENRFYRGGVSIFVVAIVSIIVGIVTVGFIRLMNRDYQSASQQDLSQSAYDSAYAGVEDAKRALASLSKLCSSSNPTDQAECKKKADLLRDNSNQSCRILAESFSIGEPNSVETVIQTNNNDKKLDQAYTCMKINTLAEDFVGEISPSQSKIIPLNTSSKIKKIKISWFTQKDSDAGNLDLISVNSDLLSMLPPADKWPQNRPPIMRSQLIFASEGVSNYQQSTIFLYPSSNGSVAFNANNTSLADLPISEHKFNKNVLFPVKCSKSLESSTYGGYACSVILNIPENTSGDPILKLSSQYRSTNYRVEMFDQNNQLLKFEGVQAIVDSTGRANDRFRRIQARVESDLSSLPIPDFSVATNGDFCKVMVVRDQTKPSTIDCK